ncbi:DNA-binding protein [Sulfolobales archaeon HS-7]|nr:DNA-binding protein [Sulfolobales archaeon HS-7]
MVQTSLEDLSTAKDIIATGHYYASVFWAEQAAGKALKALLLQSGKAVRTHDSNEILDMIRQELNLLVEEIREDAAKLTFHYIVSRYPDAANSVPYSLYTREDAEESVR